MARFYHREGERANVRERLYVIDERIRRGDFPSCTKLSRYCKVSAKTIMRDIDYMRGFFYAPLEYDSTEKGWYYSEKTFSLSTQFASDGDLQALLVLGEMLSQFEGTPLGKSIRPAYTKVLGLFKNEDGAKFKRLTERICFAQLPAAPIADSVWSAIVGGLQNNQTLEVTYAKGGRGAGEKRRFDPYGLIVRGRDWHLYGFSHLGQECRTLTLAYMSAAVLTDDFFDLPKSFDLRSYVRRGFDAMQSDGKAEVRVVLRFAPEVANVVGLRPLSHEQTVERDPDGGVQVSFKTSALFQVEREVLRWGDKVEVLKPMGLRETIKQTIKRLATLYDAS